MRWYQQILCSAALLSLFGLYGFMLWHKLIRPELEAQPKLVIKDKGVTESGRRIWVLEDSKTGKEYIVGDKK